MMCDSVCFDCQFVVHVMIFRLLVAAKACSIFKTSSLFQKSHYPNYFDAGVNTLHLSNISFKTVSIYSCPKVFFLIYT